jgi:regulatory protein
MNQQKSKDSSKRLSVPDVNYPVTIKRIEPQKKSKDRFSLFTEEGFLIGFSADTLIKSGVRKEDQVSRSQMETWVEIEQKEQIRAYLFRLLSRRDHSGFELKQKAQNIYGFTSPESVWIDDIVEGLKAKGYINEESFARKFILDKAAISGWGPGKIKSALQQKKIPSETIESLLSELLPEEQKLSTAQALLLKKKWYFDKVSEPAKRKQKMQFFLAQRGFSFSVIDQAITLTLQQQDVQKPHT